MVCGRPRRMEISAVGVAATDLRRAVAFYELSD